MPIQDSVPYLLMGPADRRVGVSATYGFLLNPIWKWNRLGTLAEIVPKQLYQLKHIARRQRKKCRRIDIHRIALVLQARSSTPSTITMEVAAATDAFETCLDLISGEVAN